MTPVLKQCIHTVCKRCSQSSTHRLPRSFTGHSFSQSIVLLSEKNTKKANDGDPISLSENDPRPEPEPGAMTRRLQEATEEALLTGGKAGRRAVEDAGFSDELKTKLLDKIAGANFRNEHAGAFAQSTLSSAAGEGTRGAAPAQPWVGDGSTPDAVLRMLDDAKKPPKPEFRGKFELPSVDMRLKRSAAVTPGRRVAAARDKASRYTGMDMKQNQGLSDAEKEEMKREFRDRFQPEARAVPATISGLTALANERIESAIARGQFKDIARGTSLKRDPTADNPFIDTTEYLLNRIIQRQNIVPPWIEKQQELVKAVHVFRTRLRKDWKRHAARIIASKSGSLQQHMARAEQFAMAERQHNPILNNSANVASPTAAELGPVEPSSISEADASANAVETPPAVAVSTSHPSLFRDPTWEKTESAYLKLSIENLNSITRSYNLMAPELARKPYYSLQRELATCFAEVAPQLASEIQLRATRPKYTGSAAASTSSTKNGSTLENLGGRDPIHVYVNKEKAYGFKEWWGDVWKKP